MGSGVSVVALIYRKSQPQRGRLADNVVMLEEAIEKRRRFIRDADDFIRCLAIEFEIELGFRLSIIPIGKLFEFTPPQCPLRQSGAFDGDADAGRLTGDSAFHRDRLGGSDRATRDEASPALVLVVKTNAVSPLAIRSPPKHRLLRGEHERLRPQIANLGPSCERPLFPKK